MIKEFEKYIFNESLIHIDDKILLAVSGGIDSVAMTSLFNNSNIKFSIAHCNFCLRGKDSDDDEIFVKNLANKYKSQYYITKFDTQKYAAKNKISIQVAARQLRFNWFKELIEKHKFTKVALAHNANDVVETMIINLCRGTGIKGLHGILPINGKYIRPLLFAQRIEIEQYVEDNNIIYREDFTNKKDIYTRNNIRINVIPHLKNSFNTVVQNICKTADIIKQQEAVYIKTINDYLEKITIKTNSGFEIEINKILEFHQPQIIVYELFSKYDFSLTQIENIFQNIKNGTSGAEYFTLNYKVLRDRDKLILSEKLTETDNETYTINSINEIINYPIKLEFSKIKFSNNIFINNCNNIIFADADNLKFPLKIRKWQIGDLFYPLGMKGKKKLSDYFNDLKISNNEKNSIYLLLSNNEIVWVINYRLSEKFKVNTTTKNIYQITSIL